MDFDTFFSKINTHQPVILKETPIAAAVLILMLYDDTHLNLIITKRSQLVTRYAGDYCFPGGTKELQDQDYYATAKREVKEELGVDETSYKLIGQLDDFYDRYAHLVRPYVATISKKAFEARINHEIERLYFFPIKDLQIVTQDKMLEKITKRQPAYKYVKDDVIIWGLTASIMVHLCNILFANDYPIGKKPKP